MIANGVTAIAHLIHRYRGPPSPTGEGWGAIGGKRGYSDSTPHPYLNVVEMSLFSHWRRLRGYYRSRARFLLLHGGRKILLKCGWFRAGKGNEFWQKMFWLVTYPKKRQNSRELWCKMTFSRKNEKMSMFFLKMYWQEINFMIIYWCLQVWKCHANQGDATRMDFRFLRAALDFARENESKFRPIFDSKVLNCVLLNKSNNKNKAKCSKFGRRNGKCFLTKVLRYDIMLIQESRTARFRVLCCLEMSKKQTNTFRLLWRSPRIPDRHSRRVQFTIDTPGFRGGNQIK